MERIKLILLTQYYPPEIGAAQNRLHELAVYLKEQGVEVTVLTAMPNYPESETHAGYKGKWHVKEEIDGITIHRAWIYASKSRSVMARLLNFFSFVFSSAIIGLFKLRRSDYIICETPPLFLGISALILRKAKGAKLITNVADLWLQTAEKTGVIKNKLLLGISKRLENWLYRSSVLITCQTEGIVQSVKEKFSEKNVIWMPNGVDMTLFNIDVKSNWRAEHGFADDDFLMIYAGNLSHICSWDMVIEAAEITAKREKRIKWIIIGWGQMKDHLSKKNKNSGHNNLYLLDPVPKQAMPLIWKAANVLFLPMKDIEVNKVIVNAKSFEALAMKVPLLLSADGESKKIFIEEAKAGVWTTPENTNDLVEKVFYLYNNRPAMKQMGENGYSYVKQHFDRQMIMKGFFTQLIEQK